MTLSTLAIKKGKGRSCPYPCYYGIWGSAGIAQFILKPRHYMEVVNQHHAMPIYPRERTPVPIE